MMRREIRILRRPGHHALLRAAPPPPQGGDQRRQGPGRARRRAGGRRRDGQARWRRSTSGSTSSARRRARSGSRCRRREILAASIFKAKKLAGPIRRRPLEARRARQDLRRAAHALAAHRRLQRRSPAARRRPGGPNIIGYRGGRYRHGPARSGSRRPTTPPSSTARSRAMKSARVYTNVSTSPARRRSRGIPLGARGGQPALGGRSARAKLRRRVSVSCSSRGTRSRRRSSRGAQAGQGEARRDRQRDHVDRPGAR